MIWYTEIFSQLKYFHNQRQNYFLTVVEVVLMAGSHEHQVCLLEDGGVVRYNIQCVHVQQTVCTCTTNNVYSVYRPGGRRSRKVSRAGTACPSPAG